MSDVTQVFQWFFKTAFWCINDDQRFKVLVKKNGYHPENLKVNKFFISTFLLAPFSLLN